MSATSLSEPDDSRKDDTEIAGSAWENDAPTTTSKATTRSASKSSLLKQKRGMKPRSQRNRKRPKSDAHALQKDFDYETVVRPLNLDGKPLGTLLGQNVQWLRLVEPYPYTFTTFAKARWEGRSILDVYGTEFGSYPGSYYETAIAQGRILVSNQKVDTSYVIKGGDVLSHTVHRHEPGVAVQSPEAPHVTIIEETDEVLVVDKPATMPVHPCGGYHVQALMNMLERYLGYKLYTIHRIDRLTSGLVILGKTSQVAQDWGKSIMNRDCQKIYLTRVKGRFPLNCPKGLTRINAPSTMIPWNGEWNETTDSEEVKHLSGASKQAADISDLRKQYAHVYWIVDEYGHLVEDHQIGVEDVFQSKRTLDTWLHSLEKHGKGDTGITSSSNMNHFWFHLACPTRIAKHKDGVCEAGSFDDLNDDLYKKSVKPAASSFAVISYDDKTDSTLLICRPFTGRSHQLRLHLQQLGHPIANDPNYGGDMWYCNKDAEKMSEMAQDRLKLVNDLQQASGADKVTQASANRTVMATFANDPTTEEEMRQGVAVMTVAIDVPATSKEVREGIAQTVQGTDESIHDFIRRTCVWCARSRAFSGEDRAILEFLIRSPGIWLHALQYSIPPPKGSTDNKLTSARNRERTNKSFRAPLPAWYEI